MSRFSVDPAALYEHIASLAGIPGEIDAARGGVLQGAGAGEGTPAAGALDELTVHIHARLGDYGASAGALHNAVNGAGQNYTSADEASAPKRKT